MKTIIDALNEIPNTSLCSTPFNNTYQLAVALSKAEKKGATWKDQTTGLFSHRENIKEAFEYCNQIASRAGEDGTFVITAALVLYNTTLRQITEECYLIDKDTIDNPPVSNDSIKGEVYSYDRMQTAMCLWEAYIDNPEAYPGMQHLQNTRGISELRHAVMCHWAEICEKDYAKLTDEAKDECFDLDFCPSWLEERDATLPSGE